ncbi:MAG: hypothetical protein WC621_03820 [Patescibacteria group bacterium]
MPSNTTWLALAQYQSKHGTGHHHWNVLLTINERQYVRTFISSL